MFQNIKSRTIVLIFLYVLSAYCFSSMITASISIDNYKKKIANYEKENGYTFSIINLAFSVIYLFVSFIAIYLAHKNL